MCKPQRCTCCLLKAHVQRFFALVIIVISEGNMNMI